jgi:DNA-binding MarR family transcriptional regulator
MNIVSFYFNKIVLNKTFLFKLYLKWYIIKRKIVLFKTKKGELMKNLNFIENLMIVHHFTKNVFRYSSIKELDSNLNETHAKILLFVYKHEYRQMSKINKYIGIQKGAFTTSVDILIDNGYIVKVKSEKDKRFTNLELTQKGIQMAIKLEENLYKSINDMFDNIDEKEKEGINDALKLLSKFCIKNKKITK